MFLIPFIAKALRGGKDENQQNATPTLREAPSRSATGSNDKLAPQRMDPNWSMPWANETFMNWLFSSFGQKPDGGWDMQGLPQYPGQVNPDVGKTMLPSVWSSWNPQGNAGTDALSALLSGGFSNPVQQMWPSIQSQGGVEGQPLQRMKEIVEYGGVANGPGLPFMQDLMTYGRPSGPAGDWMQNLAQYGIASQQSGMPLHSMAYGLPSAAGNYLAPFIGPPNYQGAAVPGFDPTKRVA